MLVRSCVIGMIGLGWLSLVLAQDAPRPDEWARFRGPNGTGIGTADLPASWADKDYRWKAKLPGLGNSSPVLWGERLFVTAGDKAGARYLLCHHADDGRLLWRRDFDSPKYKMHKRNTVATATPAVDARHVYIPWATPDKYVVMAVDHAGKTSWEVELGPYKSQHGFGVSPILFEDLLILPNEQDGASFLVALETGTGKIRWQIPRQSGNATYSTPCLYQPKGRPPEIIFTNWQHGITAVDPRAGKVTWEISAFEPKLQERAIASPFIAGDLVLGTCGFVTAQKHMVAVRPDADGKAKEVWRQEKVVSHLGTPLAKGPWIFLFSERGVISCLDAANGKLIWQQRVDDTFSSSPVCAGDKIFCVSDDGEVVVIAAADQFQLLGRGSLGEASQSTPAIARGRIYFRTQGQLLCLGGKS